MSNVHNTKCYFWQPHKGLLEHDIESWSADDKFFIEGLPVGGKFIVAVGPGDGTCEWKNPQNEISRGTLEEFENGAEAVWDEVWTDCMDELAEKLVSKGALDLCLGKEYPDGFPLVRLNETIAAWVTREQDDIMKDFMNFAMIALAMYAKFQREELP